MRLKFGKFKVCTCAAIAILMVSCAGSFAIAQQRPAASGQVQSQTQNQAPTAAPAVAPVAVPTEPQSTVATFGDWSLRCFRQEGAQSNRICEVGQTIQVQGQQGPLAQIALGRLQRADPLKFTIALPNNVAFPSTVRVAMDEKDTQPFELSWRRCVQGACVADGDPSTAIIQRFRARTEPVRLIFKDATGRDIVIPLSFRGLAQALDALAKEAA
jgi:invasion protein IalB